jgi:hypothetical protein
MKGFTLLLGVWLGVAVMLPAQSLDPTTASVGQTKVPPPTTPQVTERGANQNLWQWQTYETAPDGTIVPHVHSYTELATGLNHLVNGQWVASTEDISIQPDGTAAAVNGQHQAYFPADIYGGVIKLVTPDGQVLQSQPVGLSYDDGKNTVLIAVLTNSIGQLLGTNQVIYPNAFAGLNADLLYTYTKAGFEQDVVLHEQPPAPATLGLDPDTAKVQVLTEFLNSPTPRTTESVLNQNDGLTDTTLTFGTMQMSRGKAFAIGETSRNDGVPVYKSWEQLQGRNFLVESVPVSNLATELEQLPVSANTVLNGQHLPKVASRDFVPPIHLAKAGTKPLQLAKTDLNRKPGVVLDYFTVNAATTNFTFQGDTTYLISGADYFYGSLTFEGGTVLKYDSKNSSSSINVYCPIVCKTSEYRPAVFTYCNDDTVGAATDESGAPLYYDSVFSIDGPSSGTNIILQDLRISYSYYGLHPAYGTKFTLRDSQITHCYYAFQPESMTCYFDNVLISDVQTAYNGANCAFIASQVTVDGCSNALTAGWYASPTGSSVSFTNSLLVNVASNGLVPITTNYTVTVASRAGVFQTVGAGNDYLVTNSIYRNIGTTNLDPILLADIATKTTYPPIVYSNQTISAATTFSPQAQRDTDIPDLGYHYDPVDYFFGGVAASTNLTFTAGTVMGWFELPGNGGPGYGISLPNYVSATFNGTVTAPCVVARYDTVQEGGNGLWKDKGWLAGIIGAGANVSAAEASVLNAKFTHFALLANDPNDVRDYNAVLLFQPTDCEFWSAGFGGYIISESITNCLFDRALIAQNSSEAGNVFSIVNTTFHGGSIYIYTAVATPATVMNCALDNTPVSATGYAANASYATYDYNAHTNTSNPFPLGGSHDIVVTNNFNWLTSWFGNYYQATNSQLIDKGSTTANLIGLYYYTTQTNQVMEGYSPVDIGYHYVATDPNGNPFNSDADGVPNYLEDTNPTNPAAGVLNVFIDNPTNGTVLLQ